MIFRKRVSTKELAAIWKHDPMMFMGTELDDNPDLIKYSFLGIPEELMESQIRFFSKKWDDIFLSEVEAEHNTKTARVTNASVERSMFKKLLTLPTMTATNSMKGLQIFPVLILKRANSLNHEMFYTTDQKEQLSCLGVMNYLI